MAEHTTRRRRPRGERGAAAVEFALVIIPVLYLVLGVVTYGYMLSFRQSVSQGAAEGARAAAVVPPGFSTAQQQAAARAAVTQALGSYGISCTDQGLMSGTLSVGSCGVVVATCSNDATHSCVSVTVDYDYRSHPLVPLPGMGAVTPSELSYTAVAEVSG